MTIQKYAIGWFLWAILMYVLLRRCDRDARYADEELARLERHGPLE